MSDGKIESVVMAPGGPGPGHCKPRDVNHTGRFPIGNYSYQLYRYQMSYTIYFIQHLRKNNGVIIKNLIAVAILTLDKYFSGKKKY